MRGNSLKVRFLRSMAIALTLVFALIMVFFYLILRSEFREGVREKGEALAVMVRERAQSSLQMFGAEDSSLEVLSLDLKKLANGNQNVRHARVIRPNGLIVASHLVDEVGKRVAPTEAGGSESFLVDAGENVEVYTQIPGSEYLVQIAFDNTRFARKMMRTLLTLIFVGLGALVILYLLTNYIVHEGIELPLQTLGRDASRVASGDLTVGFQHAGSGGGVRDEMGKLSEAFANMTDGVRGIVSRIDEMAGSVSGHTERLRKESTALAQTIRAQNEAMLRSIRSMETIDAGTADIQHRVEELFVIAQETSSSVLQIGGAIEEVEQHIARLNESVAETSSSVLEISRSITEVADRSRDLARNTDDMSQALQEISTTVNDVEGNAQLSTELSKEVSKSAREGLEAVQKNGDVMGRIKSAVRETADVISELGNRSQEIGEIVTVINQVTEKTNLLALNAAIIAAAAGESGASFAVVADGIRDLARQVAAKTREIEGLVQGVQKETRRAEERVGNGLAIVDEGEKQSASAREKLKQIFDTSVRSEEMAQLIATAMSEQKKSTQALAESSTRVANISHQIASATQQEASASNQIQRAIANMEELAANVLRRSEEQGEGNRRINDGMQRLSSAVTAISDSAARFKNEGEAVLGSIQDNQSLLHENERRLAALDELLREVNNAVAHLSEAVDGFKLS